MPVKILKYRVNHDELPKLPYLAGRRLDRQRRLGSTGIMLHHFNKVAGTNYTSRYWRVVTLFERGEVLCKSDSQLPVAKFHELAPGEHRIDFASVGPLGIVNFYEDFNLGAGQIIVACCRPPFSRNPFNKDNTPEEWSIKVLDSQ